MHIKHFITALFVILLCLINVACQTEPDVVGETAVSPTAALITATQSYALPLSTTTPFPTDIPLPATTPSPTVKSSPSATAIPISPDTTETLLFLSDGNLYQWTPIEQNAMMLIESVEWQPVYQDDVILFSRKLDEETDTVILYHLPSKTEIALAQLPTQNLRLSLSPNGRWLAFTYRDDSDMQWLSIHEIRTDTVVTTTHLLTQSLDETGTRFFRVPLYWSRENEVSWGLSSGIWTMDLAAVPLEPHLTILPSQNEYDQPVLAPPPEGTDPDDWPSSSKVLSEYEPYVWSPDGRYLVVIEHFFEDSGLRIIERDSNRSFYLPDSQMSVVTDDIVWLDETHLLHFRVNGTIELWQATPDTAQFMSLLWHMEVELESEGGYQPFYNVFLIDSYHVRFVLENKLYELDIQTRQLTSLNHRIQVENFLDLELIWSLNGQQVVGARSFDGRWAFYEVLDQEVSMNLSEVVGERPCCWHWYTPQE